MTSCSGGLICRKRIQQALWASGAYSVIQLFEEFVSLVLKGEKRVLVLQLLEKR